GRDRVAQAARRAGLVLEGPLPASLALGVLETSPLDLAQAYAPFANGGMAVIAHAVESIETAEGEVLYRRRGSGPGRVIEGHRLGTFNGLMQGAMAEGGTGHQAHLGGRPAGGKTGTTQDSRDAWFAGYTADRVAVVWLGHDDGSPMKDGHGRGLTGGGLPALIWRDVMLAANEGLPVRPLPGEALPDSRPSSSEGGVPTGFWDRLQNLLGGTS
ncbi:MAG: penicillin-binding transpeptidase domain-containing protein, partial [Rhodospirillales bacterium]